MLTDADIEAIKNQVRNLRKKAAAHRAGGDVAGKLAEEADALDETLRELISLNEPWSGLWIAHDGTVRIIGEDNAEGYDAAKAMCRATDPGGQAMDLRRDSRWLRPPVIS